ncbi:MAG: M20/M25/M40 family metallo-hydrolase, partial [Rhodospirillales bacterium]|nr:M20/M25/M40 family metallo-hydrolase [Rhodospirillales bacterium]
MPSLDLSLSDYVNQDRLWERHHELGEIGRTDKGGVNRQALTTEDMLARQRVVEWAGKLGAKASIDDIGNLFLRLPGSNPVLPAIMTGSHLDTQPTGGKFDGIFGVLAGLEVFEAFVGSGLQPERTIELVVWQNEEGCRFSPSTMGSGIYTGALN